MTNYNMNPYNGQTTTPITPASADKGYGGKTVSIFGTLTLASQLSGSTFTVGVATAGWLFQGGAVYTDTSLGSTTIAIGGTIGGLYAFQSNCYKAAATLTSTDTWSSFFSNVSATHPFLTDPLVPYAASETFLITTGAATAPSSGIVCVRLHFMVP